MNQILDANLKLKVFKYSSKEEMHTHIDDMEKENWKCVRCGEYMLLPSSLVSEYNNDNNWHYVAEFSKQTETISVEVPTSYQSTVYWFNIYETEISE